MQIIVLGIWYENCWSNSRKYWEYLRVYIEDAPVMTIRKDVREIKKNEGGRWVLYGFMQGYEYYPSRNLTGRVQFEIQDIAASTFINYYSSILIKAALNRIIGINERNCGIAAGVHKPPKQQLEKIQKGINALKEELAIIK